MTDPAPTDAERLLIEGFALGPFATNCYLIGDREAGECWIIDAGFDPGELVERVRALGLTPRGVVLTHAHIDHIWGLDELRRAFPGRVPVSVHEAERAWLGDPMLNLSVGMGETFATSGPDEVLRGGETLRMGGVDWKVLHTPGHSPGGVTLYSAGAGTALVGDTLFAGSIGRFDFPTSDEQALYASIREKLYALPDETVVLPGHGPSTTIGREKRSNPFVRAK